ncbi:MAG: alpha/beta fold hydrolase, partial [Acidimicrobiia bacterium]
MDVPVTRFARTPSGSTIAYQVFGDGPVTITSVPPLAQNIEMAWGWPAIRSMFEGFASFCRFVVFDKRGTGMSDRRLDIPDLDERVDELSAVLDDAGIDRTYVMGTSEGGPMALMFAATYPERVEGVILECTAASLLDDEQRDRVERGEFDPEASERRRRFVETWGTPDSIVPDIFAPSIADDQEYRRWHQRYERNSASRDALESLMAYNSRMDARGVLHRVEGPVLIVHRVDDPVVPSELVLDTERRLRSYGVEVERLAQPGADHYIYATDLAGVLTAIERFTTGRVQRDHTRWLDRTVEITTLGRFEVRVAGEPVPTADWGSKRARTLLKRLVVARGWPVTRDELIDILWPEGGDPARLAARLSVQLSGVRRVLRGGIVADRSSIRLDLEHVDVDLERWFAAADDATIIDR